MEHTLEIDGWRTNLRFSACHMLVRHRKCSRIHGHSYAIHLKLRGETDENHYLFDFGVAKKKLREFARELDHRVMVPTDSPDIRTENDKENGQVVVDMAGKRYVFPEEDVVLIPTKASTVEELSGYLLDRLRSELVLPSGVKRISLGIDEGPGQGAWSTIDIEEG